MAGINRDPRDASPDDHRPSDVDPLIDSDESRGWSTAVEMDMGTVLLGPPIGPVDTTRAVLDFLRFTPDDTAIP